MERKLTDSIPLRTKKQIQDHFRVSCQRGEEGWEDSHADEDTVTGDFFSCLRTDWKEEKNGCKWKVRYKKFKGRGPNAFESKVGADGIFKLEIEQNNEKYIKSIIFQSKKENNENIKEQLEKMKLHAPNGNMVIVYGPNGYYGINGNDYTKSSKVKEQGQRIGDYLSNIFLECKHGEIGLDYDPVREELIRPDKRITESPIEHELIIKIKDHHKQK